MHFQFNDVPSFNEFDRMGWADTTARLAHRAISFSCREVWFDRIKRTDFDALVAVNARRFDLAFGDTEQIAQRKDCTTWADVLAPKPGT